LFPNLALLAGIGLWVLFRKPPDQGGTPHPRS